VYGGIDCAANPRATRLAEAQAKDQYGQTCGGPQNLHALSGRSVIGINKLLILEHYLTAIAFQARLLQACTCLAGGKAESGHVRVFAGTVGTPQSAITVI